MNYNELEQDKQLLERWEAVALPGDEHTCNAFSDYLQVFGRQHNVLNCAIPLARAKSLTDFELPAGVDMHACLEASITGRFPEALRDWKYAPKIRPEPQLPQMASIPQEHTSLVRAPWFQSPSQALGTI